MGGVAPHLQRHVPASLEQRGMRAANAEGDTRYLELDPTVAPLPQELRFGLLARLGERPKLTGEPVEIDRFPVVGVDQPRQPALRTAVQVGDAGGRHLQDDLPQRRGRSGRLDPANEPSDVVAKAFALLGEHPPHEPRQRLLERRVGVEPSRALLGLARRLQRKPFDPIDEPRLGARIQGPCAKQVLPQAAPRTRVRHRLTLDGLRERGGQPVPPRQRPDPRAGELGDRVDAQDRKSTRLNSSHRCNSYAVFCLKKKTLEIRSLMKLFYRPAVNGLDLTVRAGEFYSLLGPNGAGKTTTLRMVAGLLPPDAGTIRICGIDALYDPVEAKRIVAWVSDEPMIYDKLTPYEYLEFVAGLWSLDADLGEMRARELMDWLGLAPHAHERCEGFSRGMRQKVALAGALVHGPRVIILDEPLTGLDAGSARQVKRVLRERVAAGGTVIMTTHILEVAERMADRVGIIAGGRLIAEGTLDELRRQSGKNHTNREDTFLSLG